MASPGRFLRSVYLHLLGAVAVLVALEVALFRTGLAARIAGAVAHVPWLLILGAFGVVTWLASRAAHRARSRAGAYAGLAAYVLAQAAILVPLLHHAERVAPGTIGSAAALTLLGFGTLSATVFVTGYDFSPLRGFVVWGGLLALAAIVWSLLQGFRLGTGFVLAMIVLAGASILVDTGRLLRGSRRDRPAAAALALFGSVALLFWWVLRRAAARR